MNVIAFNIGGPNDPYFLHPADTERLAEALRKRIAQPEIIPDIAFVHGHIMSHRTQVFQSELKKLPVTVNYSPEL